MISGYPLSSKVILVIFHGSIVTIHLAIIDSPWAGSERTISTPTQGQAFPTRTPQPWFEPVLWGSHSRKPSYNKPYHSSLVTPLIWQPLMMFHAKPSPCFFNRIGKKRLHLDPPCWEWQFCAQHAVRPAGTAAGGPPGYPSTPVHGRSSAPLCPALLHPARWVCNAKGPAYPRFAACGDKGNDTWGQAQR